MLPLTLTAKPGRPFSVRVEGTSVSLEWTAPDYNGHHVVVGYTIKYGVGGSDPEQFKKEYVDQAITTFTFKGLLQSKTSYVFAVATKTAAGDGPFSDFSDAVLTNTG